METRLPPGARRLKLTIAYDGGPWTGWQTLPSGLTVQDKVELALRKIAAAPLRIHGSGRTDAGVHALGQVASFRIDRDWTAREWTKGFNASLPEDIAVRSAAIMPDEFHARYAARGKLYEYRIFNRPERPAIDRAYVWHLHKPLDLEAMQQAASCLIGSHDFSSFEGTLTDNEDPVCHLEQLSVTRQGNHLMIQAYADRFLKHMVRAIVGTLVEVGHAKRQPQSLEDVLTLKDRTAAGRTAPPQGLFLVQVDYDHSAFPLTDPPTDNH